MAEWQLEFGANVVDADHVRFRVWAPVAGKVEVELYPAQNSILRHAMSHEGDGVWSATVDARAGALYRYRLDEQWGYPDPYTRSQPEGVHGPSQVVDPRTFRWTDERWAGLAPESLVLYELHVGVYTPRGTFDALIEHLDALAETGVNALELMPIAEFPGRRNWGYDSAHLFAPASVYGGSESLRRLVDAAHARGLGIVLDSVYNHRAPDGDYLPVYSSDYYTDRYQTPWGYAVNFDGPNSDRVRRYHIDNALYWQHEYHIDGLRLDATHEMHDASPKHILQEIAEVTHDHADRRFLFMAEDDWRDPRLVLPPERGGYGLDALWVDDLHHVFFVMMTGDKGRYNGSYQGTAEEIVRLLSSGALYSTTAGNEAASLAAIDPWRLIGCLENHDQVGNDAQGRRLWQQIGVESCKAAYALQLFAPGTPLLFMGDEFAASTPFLYFTDLRESLAPGAEAGRAREFRQFWRAAGGGTEADPQAEETFLRSKVDQGERGRPPHDGVRRLFQELLRMRRDDPVVRLQRRDLLRAQALGKKAVAVERWNESGDRRLLIANFGEPVDIKADRFGEGRWQPALSTAEQRFGGPGAALEPLTPGKRIALPGRSATVWMQSIT
jgi:maltooligosyltrehalose trehalohydrolase